MKTVFLRSAIFFRWNCRSAHTRFRALGKGNAWKIIKGSHRRHRRRHRGAWSSEKRGRLKSRRENSENGFSSCSLYPEETDRARKRPRTSVGASEERRETSWERSIRQESLRHGKIPRSIRLHRRTWTKQNPTIPPRLAGWLAGWSDLKKKDNKKKKKKQN